MLLPHFIYSTKLDSPHHQSKAGSLELHPIIYDSAFRLSFAALPVVLVACCMSSQDMKQCPYGIHYAATLAPRIEFLTITLLCASGRHQVHFVSTNIHPVSSHLSAKASCFPYWGRAVSSKDLHNHFQSLLPARSSIKNGLRMSICLHVHPQCGVWMVPSQCGHLGSCCNPSLEDSLGELGCPHTIWKEHNIASSRSPWSWSQSVFMRF